MNDGKPKTKGKRKRVPPNMEADVAMKSRRRCCLCFYYDSDTTEKQGQVAHLDYDPSNNDPANLARLCMAHHDRYDSRTSQSKNYTIHEAKECRRKLFEYISADGLMGTPNAVPAEERRFQVDQQRADFERTVAEDRFHKFRADMAIVAMTVIPSIPLLQPAQYCRSNELVFRRFFQPIGTSGCEPKLDRGLVVFSTLSAVTEVRKDGSVLAVLNMKCGEDSEFSLPELGIHPIKPDKPYVVSMDRYQPRMIGALQNFLAGLNALRVSGPWYFGLSILKAKNCRLIPNQGWDFNFAGGHSRPCEHETMLGKRLLLAADLNVNGQKAVETVIRPSLRDIWEYCGYSAPPSFDDDGFKFVG